MTEKEITAMKAVLYLALRNPRLKLGGTYVEDINNYETCGKIPFAEAVRIVDSMLYGSETETEAKP